MNTETWNWFLHASRKYLKPLKINYIDHNFGSFLCLGIQYIYIWSGLVLIFGFCYFCLPYVHACRLELAVCSLVLWSSVCWGTFVSAFLPGLLSEDGWVHTHVSSDWEHTHPQIENTNAFFPPLTDSHTHTVCVILNDTHIKKCLNE